MLFCISLQTMAQTDGDNPEDREVDMDAPTFEPMVKVGKALVDKDSIQYVQVNNVYVYPQPVFKNAKERMAYNRLVYNIKKVLPIAKEVRKIIIETGDYHLIQAFLGPIRAGFYQAFATLFGASLNKKYDPNGVDRLTERVVRQVESGQI